MSIASELNEKYKVEETTAKDALSLMKDVNTTLSSISRQLESKQSLLKKSSFPESKSISAAMFALSGGVSLASMDVDKLAVRSQKILKDLSRLK